MHRARAILVGISIAVAVAFPRPAAAYASSCGTFTVTLSATTCTYRASGAGQYRAITLSGWRISISRAGGPFQTVLEAKQNGCATPPSNAVSTGTVPALPGDLVRLEIRQACFQETLPSGNFPPSAINFQAGTISGGDGAGVGVPSGPPSVTHLDPSNFCVALDTAPVTTGTLTCHYTAHSALGEITQMTPNHITVTWTDGSGTHTAYSQSSPSLPGRSTYSQPVGAVMTVTVGPDSVPSTPVAGAVGIIIAGDSV